MEWLSRVFVRAMVVAGVYGDAAIYCNARRKRNAFRGKSGMSW